MHEADCTHSDAKRKFDILEFVLLPEWKIERFRYHLKCLSCGGVAFYRKQSIDGKDACFGSRYHATGCNAERSSRHFTIDVANSIEVDKAIKQTNEFILSFNDFEDEEKLSDEARVKKVISEKATTGTTTKTSSSSKKTTLSSLSLDRILSSLIRGKSLVESDVIIRIGDFPYKAKNLFVNFEDAHPENNAKDAKPKMYWGTISFANKEISWLNPQECKNMGIPITKFSEKLIKKYSINDRWDLHGAAIILFGKCYWNKDKDRKIIEVWDNDINKIYLSMATV
ncbi:hypothetical protein DN730_18630 [Marinomonas piezotolerans]|uniref:Uncharacterized protein n=1 Tax=Marinomonas piezotolerans TaxID=2213058 RepID=A0A370U4B8_9GAMM|nr:hypothetical protein [Marinomonas piezotolerans]RDL42624.1 hypothetical protein DN730_18630 [Marinomonas piezotolerans]